VLQVTWSRSMVCSGAGGGDVLWAKRSRVKQSSGVDGEAVEATACSEGALCSRRRALSVGDVEDLKCTSGENLLSVERATRVPDIYVGGQMHDAHSLWHVTYFFQARRTLFLDERRAFSEACHPFFLWETCGYLMGDAL
jgi:hypothetical protein